MTVGILALAAATAFGGMPSRPEGYVSDFAGILSPSEESTLEALATEIERRSSAEVAVVTVSSLDGGTVETYAAELFQKWGIGKAKEDNGLLILVAPQDRKYRFEVGYGLEGVIPDGRAGQIGRERLVPAFRERAYGRGLLEALGDIQGLLLVGPDAPRREPLERKLRGVKLTLLVVVILIFFLMRFLIGPSGGGPWYRSPRRRGYWTGGQGGFGSGWGGGGWGGGSGGK